MAALENRRPGDVAQQRRGRSDLSSNDSSFATDTDFPNGVTDYKDTTDPSVEADTKITTDTKFMSPDMVKTHE